MRVSMPAPAGAGGSGAVWSRSCTCSMADGEATAGVRVEGRGGVSWEWSRAGRAGELAGGSTVCSSTVRWEAEVRAEQR